MKSSAYSVCIHLGQMLKCSSKAVFCLQCLLISTIWMIGCRILSINLVSNSSMQIRKSFKRVNSNVIRKQKTWFDQPAQSKQIYFSNPAYSGLSNKLFKIVCQVQKHLENVSEERSTWAIFPFIKRDKIHRIHYLLLFTQLTSSEKAHLTHQVFFLNKKWLHLKYLNSELKPLSLIRGMWKMLWVCKELRNTWPVKHVAPFANFSRDYSSSICSSLPFQTLLDIKWNLLTPVN